MGEILYSIEEFAPDRDKVSVFGKEYEILSYDDFGLKENAEIQREGKRLFQSILKLSPSTDFRATPEETSFWHSLTT